MNKEFAMKTAAYLSPSGLEMPSMPALFSRMGIVSAGRGPSLTDRYAPMRGRRRCSRHCTYTSGTPSG